MLISIFPDPKMPKEVITYKSINKLTIRYHSEYDKTPLKISIQIPENLRQIWRQKTSNATSIYLYTDHSEPVIEISVFYDDKLAEEIYSKIVETFLADEYIKMELEQIKEELKKLKEQQDKPINKLLKKIEQIEELLKRIRR